MLQLYLGGTAFGNLLQVGRTEHPFQSIMGASSGIGAILVYWIAFNPHDTIYLYFFPVRAWIVGALFMGYSFLMMNSTGGGVGHAGHFGGGLFGGLMYLMARYGYLKR